MSVAAQARQALVITGCAAAVLAVLMLLPGGSRLTPMDFVADRRTVLQFCDPENFRPLPAVSGGPAVTLAQDGGAAGAGGRTAFTLTTVSGKPIGPGDLLPRGRPEIRLRVTGPSGEAAGPAAVEPGPRPGAWILRFKPGRPGIYHIRVTFVPEAIAREWSAEADIVY